MVYSVFRNSISPWSSRQGLFGFSSSTSQFASALAFISRSTSAYTLVVVNDTCPSHARIVLMSTPERRSTWPVVMRRGGVRQLGRRSSRPSAYLVSFSALCRVERESATCTWPLAGTVTCAMWPPFRPVSPLRPGHNCQRCSRHGCAPARSSPARPVVSGWNRVYTARSGSWPGPAADVCWAPVSGACSTRPLIIPLASHDTGANLPAPGLARASAPRRLGHGRGLGPMLAPSKARLAFF